MSHNIFTFINDILFQKKGKLLDNIDFESGYNPYMVNRWISMYSPQMAELVNHTVNRLYSVFDTKKDSYKFLVAVLPKSKFYRINYIKKVKKDKVETDAIGTVAKNLELSKREINYYVNSHNIDIEGLKKACQ